MGHCLTGHLNLSNVIVLVLENCCNYFPWFNISKKSKQTNKKTNVFVKSLKNLTEFKYLRKWYCEKINFPLVDVFFLLGRLKTSLGYLFWRLRKLGDQLMPIAVEVDG